jgi:MerC mercury resistance protein
MFQKTREMTKLSLEKIGVSLSFICAIHCIITPLLLFILPLFGSTFSSFHIYENPIMFASFLLAFYILFTDFKMHKNPLPLLLIGLASAIKIVEYFGKLHRYELIIAPIIAVLVTIAYYLNWKHRKKCHCEHVH